MRRAVLMCRPLLRIVLLHRTLAARVGAAGLGAFWEPHVGIAKMGPPDDPMSVVNHELKVSIVTQSCLL